MDFESSVMARLHTSVIIRFPQWLKLWPSLHNNDRSNLMGAGKKQMLIRNTSWWKVQHTLKSEMRKASSIGFFWIFPDPSTQATFLRTNKATYYDIISKSIYWKYSYPAPHVSNMVRRGCLICSVKSIATHTSTISSMVLLELSTANR